MCQFRDNILVASSYPDSHRVELIHIVCKLLGSAWNLKVLCDCQPEHPTCQFTCLKTHTTAMGFCLVRAPGGEGLVYLHPNALTASWELKQGEPLKLPDSQHAGYISRILTGALAASNPWCNSWGG